MSTEFKLDYIAKVEGHGRLVLDIAEGNLKDVRFEIFEGARLFEGIVRGRKFDEIPSITSRICAICSASHGTVALKALENAMGIKPSEQTKNLRELLVIGEYLESHSLHIYLLALPDYIGYPSAIKAAEKYPNEVKRGLMLKKLGNAIQSGIGGRAIHQSTLKINGFTELPSKKTVENLLSELKGAKEDVMKTVELFDSLDTPEFERKTNYVSLSKPNYYPLTDGDITTSDEDKVPQSKYSDLIEESVLSYSNSKASTINGKCFLTGALARINLNANKLSDNAKEALSNCETKFPNYSIFKNNLAQAIEMVHCVDKAIEIIENLKLKDENTDFKQKSGEGIAATEAPRGTLIHHYWIDKDGIVNYGNVLTPTALNVKNVEEDAKLFLSKDFDIQNDQLMFDLEKLVRAYDPCISCSVH